MSAAPATVIFGGDLNYPPYEWREDGKAKGFLIDLEDELARAGNARAEHRLGPWPETVAGLRKGHVDVVPMFRSDKREVDFWFSKSVFFSNHAIFTAKDPGGVSDVSALDGWRVAVEHSSFAHDQLLAANWSGNLVLVGNTKEALDALSSGQADYAILAEGPAARLASGLPKPISRVAAPFWPREYAFAVRRDRPAVIAWVERSLDQVISSGEFRRIQSTWQSEFDGQQPHEATWPAYKWAAALAAGLAALSLLLLRVRSRLRTTDRKLAAAEDTLSFMSKHDPTTGLPQRWTFAEDLDTFIETLPDARLEIITFKLINAADAGSASDLNEILAVISEELKASSFGCGRLSENTFGALVAAGTGHAIIERISSRLEREGVTSELIWGAARFPDHGSDAQTLLHRAELALASCALSGRKWLVYEAALEPTAESIKVLKDFAAFGKDDIFAVYQPQLDLQSGEIVAAETLVRWKHAELGMIAPDNFIPQLEQAGLIGEVTQRMIEFAVKQSVRFREQGFPLHFSVNVSVKDFTDRDLAAIIRDKLKTFGGIAEDITIELTESGAVTDQATVRNILNQLKKTGVRTSIDDFGTGFSSLVSFTELPFDELKIDRVFVDKMTTSAGHLEAVKSALTMAKRMKLEVVAEGAPDLRTIQMLKKMRCDRVQSFVVSPPLEPDDLLRFVTDFNADVWRTSRPTPILRLVQG